MYFAMAILQMLMFIAFKGFVPLRVCHRDVEDTQ